MPLSDLHLGLAFYGLVVLTLTLYSIFNIRVLKKPIRRKAWQDEVLIRSGQVDYHKVGETMSARMIPANSGLVGITFAAIFIVSALILAGRFTYENTTEEVLVYVVLGSAAIAAICWLFCIDLIIQMAAPSIEMDRMLKFYKYATDLWGIGIFLILIAVHLFLLVVNVYLGMVLALSASIITIPYWKINNDW